MNLEQNGVLGGDSLDPFAALCHRASPEERRRAYGEFESFVDTDFRDAVSPNGTYNEDVWIAKCRQRLLDQIGYVTDPDFVANVHFLLVTLDPVTEIPFQRTPLVNKLLQWGETMELLSRVTATAKRYRLAVEYDYARWKAVTERECIAEAVSTQSQAVKDACGKQMAASAIRLSAEAIQAGRMRRHPAVVDYFEKKLLYLNHLEDVTGSIVLIIRGMSYTTSLVARMLAGEF